MRGRAVRRQGTVRQHLAGEIERAGDQDARRRIEIEACATATSAVIDVAAARGRNADRARGIGDRVRRQRSSPDRGIGTAIDALRKPGKISSGNAAQSLVASMPTTSTSGRDTRSSRSASAFGDGAAAIGIVAAVEPQLAARRRKGGEPPCARRCMRAGHSALAMPALERRRREA